MSMGSRKEEHWDGVAVTVAGITAALEGKDRADEEAIVRIVGGIPTAAAWDAVLRGYNGHLLEALGKAVRPKGLSRLQDALFAIGVHRDAQPGQKKRPKAAARTEAARLAAASANSEMYSECGSTTNTVTSARRQKAGQKESLDELRQKAFREASTVHALQRELAVAKRAAKLDAKKAKVAAKKAKLQQEDAEELKERNRILCGGLVKWAEALDPVVSSLSATSKVWADRMAEAAPAQEAAEPSQGVLADLLVTNSEILAKLTHLRRMSDWNCTRDLKSCEDKADAGVPQPKSPAHSQATVPHEPTPW